MYLIVHYRRDFINDKIKQAVEQYLEFHPNTLIINLFDNNLNVLRLKQTKKILTVLPGFDERH